MVCEFVPYYNCCLSSKNNGYLDKIDTTIYVSDLRDIIVPDVLSQPGSITFPLRKMDSAFDLARKLFKTRPNEKFGIQILNDSEYTLKNNQPIPENIVYIRGPDTSNNPKISLDGYLTYQLGQELFTLANLIIISRGLSLEGLSSKNREISRRKFETIGVTLERTQRMKLEKIWPEINIGPDVVLDEFLLSGNTMPGVSINIRGKIGYVSTFKNKFSVEYGLNDLTKPYVGGMTPFTGSFTKSVNMNDDEIQSNLSYDADSIYWYWLFDTEALIKQVGANGLTVSGSLLQYARKELKPGQTIEVKDSSFKAGALMGRFRAGKTLDWNIDSTSASVRLIGNNNNDPQSLGVADERHWAFAEVAGRGMQVLNIQNNIMSSNERPFLFTRTSDESNIDMVKSNNIVKRYAKSRLPMIRFSHSGRSNSDINFFANTLFDKYSQSNDVPTIRHELFETSIATLISNGNTIVNRSIEGIGQIYESHDRSVFNKFGTSNATAVTKGKAQETISYDQSRQKHQNSSEQYVAAQICDIACQMDAQLDHSQTGCYKTLADEKGHILNLTGPSVYSAASCTFNTIPDIKNVQRSVMTIGENGKVILSGSTLAIPSITSNIFATGKGSCATGLQSTAYVDGRKPATQYINAVEYPFQTLPPDTI